MFGTCPVLIGLTVQNGDGEGKVQVDVREDETFCPLAQLKNEYKAKMNKGI